jgi:Fe-Mn family superoxide dismutase
MKRREFIASSMLGGLSAVTAAKSTFSSSLIQSKEEKTMAFTLPNLSYAHEALEPYIDKMTMEIHHGKHHAAYVTNLNNAVQNTEWEKKSLEEILAHISKLPVAVRNNGGGHWNHSAFWLWMKPKGGGQPGGDLSSAIARDFGSYDKFKEQFTQAAMGRFGSGWAWLIKQHDKLVIASTPNQDNPLMDIADVKGVPILGVDVWEHAYYLKYQNRRADYLQAWWNVVNWEEAGRRFMNVK